MNVYVHISTLQDMVRPFTGFARNNKYAQCEYTWKNIVAIDHTKRNMSKASSNP